jgi:hypothetical protein
VEINFTENRHYVIFDCVIFYDTVYIPINNPTKLNKTSTRLSQQTFLCLFLFINIFAKIIHNQIKENRGCWFLELYIEEKKRKNIGSLNEDVTRYPRWR